MAPRPQSSYPKYVRDHQIKNYPDKRSPRPFAADLEESAEEDIDIASRKGFEKTSVGADEIVDEFFLFLLQL
jgi:hypothetical protein